jgi:HlyD family secretion protein
MSRGLYVDLADCSEFRQTVAARPPRIVHGAVLLLVTLLTAAVVWSALVKANLVVRAAGRVRPAETPTRLFTSLGADLEGRVIEAPFEEGDLVRKGDVLVRVDTARLDNRIAKLERTIAASEEELVKLAGLQELLVEQLASAREKAQAELAQAEAAFAVARQRRASEIRAAQAEIVSAEDYVRRLVKLRQSRASADQELVSAETRLSLAQERLVQAEVPVDEGQVAIARRELELVDRDFAVRRAELAARRAVKQGESEAASNELANLNLQRAEAVMRSPLDGVIVAGRIQPGDVLEPGKPVLEIAPQRGYLFEAAVPSEDVGNLRVGMPVQIKFDAFDYQKYGVLPGKVVYLSPDSKLSETGGAAPQSAESSAVRGHPPAYLVRIELHAQEVGRGELRGPVKLGLGGTAEIVTGRESLLAILVKRIRQTISLG